MSKTKNKPGIHLYKIRRLKPSRKKKGEKQKLIMADHWYWHAIAPNGRITANGETYSRKQTALNSVRSTSITLGGKGKFKYYDHSKKDCPRVNYL
jgi:uncharacterized protein YegP (UPF0339 family)